MTHAIYIAYAIVYLPIYLPTCLLAYLAMESHIHSAMKGRNDVYIAYAAYIYTVRWKEIMTHAQRTLPIYIQCDEREE